MTGRRCAPTGRRCAPTGRRRCSPIRRRRRCHSVPGSVSVPVVSRRRRHSVIVFISALRSVNVLIFCLAGINQFDICSKRVCRQPKIQRAANRQSRQAFCNFFHRSHFLYANSLIKKITSKPPTISFGTSRAIPISANISGMLIPPLTQCLRLVKVILQSSTAFVIREALKVFENTLRCNLRFGGSANRFAVVTRRVF